MVVEGTFFEKSYRVESDTPKDMQAMMATHTGIDQQGLIKHNSSFHLLATNIQESQLLECKGRFMGNITVPGLKEQLSQVEQLGTKLMCLSMARSKENLTNGNAITSLIDSAMQVIRKFSQDRQILNSNLDQVESEVRQLNIMVDSAVMSMASVLDLCQEYIIQSKLQRKDKDIKGNTGQDSWLAQDSIGGFPANKDQRAKNIQEKMEILETKSRETTVGSTPLRFNILLNSWDVEENPGPSPSRSLFFCCNENFNLLFQVRGS